MPITVRDKSKSILNYLSFPILGRGRGREGVIGYPVETHPTMQKQPRISRRYACKLCGETASNHSKRTHMLIKHPDIRVKDKAWKYFSKH